MTLGNGIRRARFNPGKEPREWSEANINASCHISIPRQFNTGVVGRDSCKCREPKIGGRSWHRLGMRGTETHEHGRRGENTVQFQSQNHSKGKLAYLGLDAGFSR